MLIGWTVFLIVILVLMFGEVETQEDKWRQLVAQSILMINITVLLIFMSI